MMCHANSYHATKTLRNPPQLLSSEGLPALLCITERSELERASFDPSYAGCHVIYLAARIP